MATRLRVVDCVLAQGPLNIIEVPGKFLRFQKDTGLQPSDPLPWTLACLRWY